MTTQDLSSPDYQSMDWIHLLAIDPLQVEVVEPVDDEGAPQRQTDHRVPLRVDGQLVQTPHLSQRRQLEKTTDVGFQKDQVLPEKVTGFMNEHL